MRNGKLKYLFLLLISVFILSEGFAIEPLSNAQVAETLDQVGGREDSWTAEIGAKVQKAGDKTFDFINDQVGDITRDIGLTIFEELTQFTLFSAELRNGGNVSTQVNRRLFPNHDILDSYTVVDTFRIPWGIPLYSVSNPLEIVTGAYAGLSLGTSGAFEVNNIRQIVPRYQKSYPHFDDLKLKAALIKTVSPKEWIKEVQSSVSYTNEELEKINARMREIKEQISESEVIDHKDEFFLKSWLKEPVNVARYSKLLNIFASPLKLPLKARQLKKLHDGEIISYTSSGYLQLSGNIGWSYSLAGVTSPIRTQFSTTTYINGDYRVSIIKESNEKVRVKVSRIRRLGINKSFYPLTIGHTLLDGFAVLGQDLSQKINITPFSSSTSSSIAKNFDVIYRYDLTKPEGVSAYEKAVLGLLAESEDTARIHENVDEPAVEKIISRNTISKTDARTKKWEINFLVKWTKTKSFTISRSTIVIPSGPDKGLHHVRNATFNKTKQWSNIFGRRERKSEIFTASMDEERVAQGHDNGFGLSVQLITEDSNTSAREMNKYLKKYRFALSHELVNSRVLKALPHEVPKHELKKIDKKKKNKNSEETEMDEEHNDQKWQKANYGSTNIYFRMQINWPQILKFVRIENDKMLKIIEGAFELDSPLEEFIKEHETFKHADERSNYAMTFHRAQRFFVDWLKLKKLTQDYPNFYIELARLFKNTGKGFKATKILLESLKDETIAYQFNFTNKKIGNINESASSFTTVDKFNSDVNQMLTIDNIGNRNFSDPEAAIQSLKAERQEDGRIKVDFKTSKEPKHLFIKLEQYTFGFAANEVKVVISNKNKYKDGENTFYLDKNSGSHYIRQLSSILKNGLKYKLTMATSIDGESWGALKETFFIARRLDESDESSEEEITDIF